MRTVFGSALVAFSLTMAAALPAEAALVVQTKVAANTATQVHPFFHVKTTSGSQTIAVGTSVRYYLYEFKMGVTFNTPTAPPSTTISVKRLSRTFTGPATTNKNASYMVTVTTTISRSITTSGGWDFDFPLTATDGRMFDQTDDYSYPGVGATMFADNNKVVLQAQNATTTLWGSVPTHDRANQRTLARTKIKHVIVIMQENRSFDHYFGAIGIAPPYVDPLGNVMAPVDGLANIPPNQGFDRISGCNARTYNPSLLGRADTGYAENVPHYMHSAKTSLGCQQLPIGTEQNRTCNDPNTGAPFSASAPLLIKDFLSSAVQDPRPDPNMHDFCNDTDFNQVVGHYVGNTVGDPVYNHWTIAKNYILQDRMFAPVPSYSLMSHMFMVSGWTARCDVVGQCGGKETYDGAFPSSLSRLTHAWNELSSDLSDKSVSWGYYHGEGFNANCGGGAGVNETCKTSPLSCFNDASDYLPPIWDPLRDFSGVKSRNNTSKIQGLTSFLSAVQAGESSVPQVSWIVPGLKVSEHPTGGDLRNGEAYVTMLLKAIMANTALYNSSAIFLAWDDWGAYYDHVRPPMENVGGTNQLMYGIRVGGVTISPMVHSLGTLDHQTLSFDAYLKFIEDIFLPSSTTAGAVGKRIGGDGRPSPAREDQAVLGDLLDEFDFHRTLLAPVAAVSNLSCANCGSENDPCCVVPAGGDSCPYVAAPKTCSDFGNGLRCHGI